VLPEETVDAFRETLHNLILPPQHGRKVERHVPKSNAVCPEVTGLTRPTPARLHTPFRELGGGEELARLEKRLARDASHTETGPAERWFSLHTGDVHPKLRSPDGGDIASGTGADDDQIMLALSNHPLVSFYQYCAP
jgi:hypothetical protein